MSQEGGREQQKLRTRRALLAAARELLEAGRQPAVQDVADHAGISRATAYRYYSNVEPLLQEAVLDGIALRLDGFDAGGGAALSIDDTVDRILVFVLEHEALFRAYLRVAASAEGPRERGARRLNWLDKVAPAALKGPARQRLLHALALVSGIEPVIVAKDICGLDDAGTRDLCRWTARAVLRAALSEAEGRGS